MPLMSRKGILAVAAVIDIALNSEARPVSAKALASRHGLPPRHLEPVLQALVHEGILRGVRGPRGGYELGRNTDSITANEILRAAGTVDDATTTRVPASPLVGDVVLPALAKAEVAFAAALSTIHLDELIRRAEKSA
ncbi:Rrf2 family transcriptional regulator [Pseudorhodoplanes sp.]|jgi:Rrf2 family protein|uniref:RrF2 family transcriptional regulator n=1 Tax=Pseudorhodoplanes sp. TaxID=1934341 RepID=UPI002BED2939|nr:Rrf2 family transcriptional regulator [Pseudorhodoplanes sp.]HWV44288.1 Rrf2 family transcriptional regulator [Pseudorhodoplanes sp.]